VRALRRVAETWQALGWRADVGLACVAAVAYAVIGLALFERRPTGIDEVVSLWQAGNFLQGRLSQPFPALPEAVLTRFTGIGIDGHIGQFSFGTMLMLVPFVAIGMPWLAGPCWGAVALVVWSRFVRRIEADAPTALLAVLLLAISPFWTLQSTSQMAHVPLTAAMLGVGLALHRVVAPDAPASRAIVLGLVVGVAALLRPLEALAAAVPAAVIVLWLVARGRLAIGVVGYGLLGVAGPLAVLLGANAVQTGSPFLFGYDAVWGANHSVGFHDTPLGGSHTPGGGVANLQNQLVALGQAAWQSRLSALIPAALALVLGIAGVRLLDAWLLAMSVGVLVGYFFYWADARWLGPRFVLPVLPLVLLWAARLPLRISRWGRWPVMAAVALLGLGVLDGLVRGVPAEFRRIDAFERTMTIDLAPALANAPPEGVVLVRDGSPRQFEARIRRLVGNAAAARTLLRRATPCEGLWLARSIEAGAAPREIPAMPASWQAWCDTPEARAAWRQSGDATGALLLFGTPARPVYRDLGARTRELVDTATLRERTVLLGWERVSARGWRPRLLRLDADSALTAWAAEDSAFAAARREVIAP
jgi:4-amino-4-deoxy-L-arabinose transferase-like glycosyltransferase